MAERNVGWESVVFLYGLWLCFGLAVLAATHVDVGLVRVLLVGTG